MEKNFKDFKEGKDIIFSSYLATKEEINERKAFELTLKDLGYRYISFTGNGNYYIRKR